MSQQQVDPFYAAFPPMVEVTPQLVAQAVGDLIARGGPEAEALLAIGQSVPAPANVIMTPPEAELAQLVPAYVEPQPTGKRAAKVVAKIDDIEDMVTLFDKAVREHNEMGARIEALREQIIAKMKAAGGDRANSATVKGVEVFTFNPKGSYRTRDLQKDYPDLCQTYVRPVTKDTFDMDAFKKDHPGIADRYQTLEFRRATGIKGMR